MLCSIIPAIVSVVARFAYVRLWRSYDFTRMILLLTSTELWLAIRVDIQGRRIDAPNAWLRLVTLVPL